MPFGLTEVTVAFALVQIPDAVYTYLLIGRFSHALAAIPPMASLAHLPPFTLTTPSFLATAAVLGVWIIYAGVAQSRPTPPSQRFIWLLAALVFLLGSLLAWWDGGLLAVYYSG